MKSKEAFLKEKGRETFGLGSVAQNLLSFTKQVRSSPGRNQDNWIFPSARGKVESTRDEAPLPPCLITEEFFVAPSLF